MADVTRICDMVVSVLAGEPFHDCIYTILASDNKKIIHTSRNHNHISETDKEKIDN